MALVLLHRFSTSIEAAVVRSRLSSEGIECFLFDVEEVWDTSDRSSQPVRLMVAEEDHEPAAELLSHALNGEFRLGEGVED